MSLPSSLPPKALLSCLEHWTAWHQYGGQQIGRALLRAGWEVGYVSEPVSLVFSTLRAWRQKMPRQRIALWRQGGIREADGRLWAYVPAAPLTPQNRPGMRSRWLYRHWWRLTWPNVVRTVRRAGFDRADLLYFDSAKFAFWLREIPHRASVLRIPDHTPAMRSYYKTWGQAERELAGQVDLVVYSAASLADYVASLRPRQAMYLPNGVNYPHFSRPTQPPPEYAQLPRPIVVCHGTFSYWFDFPLVQQAAEALPNFSFVLVGPDKTVPPELRLRANVHVLGPRPYEEIPRYLHAADMGIVPFKVAEHYDHVRGINPLRLWEFLAAGLPVVAVRWPELEDLGVPARLVDTPQEFVAALRAAVDQPPDRDRLRQFAQRNSWDQRVAVLLERLKLTAPTTADV